MRTNFDTLISLASYTINNLKESEYITFPVDKRMELVDAFATEMAVSFSTDDDIKQQAIEEIEDKMGQEMVDDEVTETEMFNHARKEIIKAFNGESIGGLYLAESLNLAAERLIKFLMDSDLVEDIFGTDEEIKTFLISKLRKFTPQRV
jgi:hypothetical protein